MRYSTASLYALCGAAVVSAKPCKKVYDPLPLEHFGNFTVITLEDAQAGVLRSHNGTTSKVSDYPSGGYPTGSPSSAVYSIKPGYWTSHPEAASGYTSSPTSTAAGYPSYPSSPASGHSSSPASSAGSSPSGAASSPSYTNSHVHPASSSGSGYSSPSSTSLPGNSSIPGHSSGSSLSSAAQSSTLSAASQSSTGSASSLSLTSASLSASQTLSVNIPSLTSSTAPVVSTSAAATCEKRTEWRSYSDDDKHAFSAAIKCLIDAPASGQFSHAKNRYEDIVRVHQMMVDTIHGNNIFLFWHRYYVWTLQQIMKDECGFTGAFPWWDETLDAGNFASSPIFTPEFFGSMPKSKGNKGSCITDGYFADTVCHIGPGTGFTDHCLSRAVDETLTAQASKAFVTTCNSRSNYPDMENCAELGPHAYGHNGVGSIMADVSASPSDPVFFLHHLFIDRNFWVWQNNEDAVARNTQINGCIDGQTPCTPLTLDTVLSVGGLRPDVTVRDVIDTTNGIMCYSYSY
ncbi:hypothetical protein BKA67DRAFT_696072 [Truncatella angustata]|uniref:Tyrosinase copper-binding domain-containing protein n=1 Tax=Truncatella angustata TaxID=152316 RepID=A0A9P8RMY0_9PEZI|nr:uncharacterized protein BKA67DRAFT_696072 [Truncatella angustata]KAH6646180.1 hypothetical protein BKA67DRAFT_696072 [Truncatella angustata]KAH8203909.1 hypothetical protein TruAng_001973 [Truncatella angustata]